MFCVLAVVAAYVFVYLVCLGTPTFDVLPFLSAYVLTSLSSYLVVPFICILLIVRIKVL